MASGLCDVGPRKNIPFPICRDYMILLQFYVALSRPRLVKPSRVLDIWHFFSKL